MKRRGVFQSTSPRAGAPLHTATTCAFYATRDDPAILKVVVSASNLGKRYGRRWIFRGIDFSLETGEILVVTGGNGVGKSTLLKTLVGLIPASEGHITLPVRDERVSLGYASVEQNCYVHLTGREHLSLFAQMRGCDSDVDSLLEEVGLTRAGDQLVQEYSTGMRGRLRLALARIHQPQVLVLDEPSAGLDGPGVELVREMAVKQRERGVAILATNDPRDVELANVRLDLGGTPR